MLTVVVVPEDSGAASLTYQVTVTRTAASTVNTLSALSFSAAGTLAPAFSSGTLTYTYTVTSAATAATTATATMTDAFSTQTVQGAAVASAVASSSIALATGDTVVTIVVTSESGAPNTYTVTVHRKDSVNTLSALALAGVTLSPVFCGRHDGVHGDGAVHDDLNYNPYIFYDTMSAMQSSTGCVHERGASKSADLDHTASPTWMLPLCELLGPERPNDSSCSCPPRKRGEPEQGASRPFYSLPREEVSVSTHPHN